MPPRDRSDVGLGSLGVTGAVMTTATRTTTLTMITTALTHLGRHRRQPLGHLARRISQLRICLVLGQLTLGHMLRDMGFHVSHHCSYHIIEGHTIGLSNISHRLTRSKRRLQLRSINTDHLSHRCHLLTTLAVTATSVMITIVVSGISNRVDDDIGCAGQAGHAGHETDRTSGNQASRDGDDGVSTVLLHLLFLPSDRHGVDLMR